MTEAMLTNVKSDKHEGAGPSIAIVHRVDREAGVVVYDRASNPFTARFACTINRNANKESIPSGQDSYANIPAELKGVDADIIVLVKGDINRRESYTTTITKGVLDYWGNEAVLGASSRSATPTAMPTSTDTTSAGKTQ
jgi:hypothetical protein